MSARGEINGWRCADCGAHTYVVHVDDGVTPMFLACRATEGCKGTGVSLMYSRPPVPQHVIDAVEWEWFRPQDRAVRRMEAGMRDHIKRGGLDLRRLTDAGRTELAAASTEGGEG
jgi:hypothetical protein